MNHQLMAQRNIELMKECEALRDQLNTQAYKHNSEYKKLWLENEKLRRKIEMINEFTKNERE